jgi:Response regulator
MNTHAPICVVDDDEDARLALRLVLEQAGFAVKAFASADAFLADDVFSAACLVADLVMPGIDGFALQRETNRRRPDLPVVIITGHGLVDHAVKAMKAGAVDFLEKPFNGDEFIDCVKRAITIGERIRQESAQIKAARRLTSTLTPREKDVLDELVGGLSNKAVAQKLGISPRTVEVYRAQIMTKLHADSLSDLVRTALAAGRET